MSIADTVGSGSQTFDWRRWPEPAQLQRGWLDQTRRSHPFLDQLADRMLEEASVHLFDFVDHFVVRNHDGLTERLVDLGFSRELTPYEATEPVYGHREAMFPRVVVRPATVSDRGTMADRTEILEVAIQVESVADFSRAHDLGLEIVGWPLGPYRIARIPGSSTRLAVVERRAYLGFEPYPGDLAQRGQMAPTRARDILAARELWKGRRRSFPDDGQAFDAADMLIERMIEIVGDRDLVCHLVFEVERDYWESRNRAARVQKHRQDRLGLGWANHDHHTFRSSREHFPRLMKMFKTLGFNLRESFHAGAEAGWGAQVLEHPVTGIVIFADLDLAPEEANQDFAHHALPALDRPNTVGLWVGLHGESIHEAGMHHLEAQFDFDRLRDDLEREAEIATMTPFSNFPFLRQAFTQGETWVVPKHRADRCLERGWITSEEHVRFLQDGARGSHLENLQRTEGYKGFNQQAVNAIITETDPRRG